ncbi:MAG: hypothetical protein QM767_04925 [Anaeromyxobacter sp.]
MRDDQQGRPEVPAHADQRPAYEPPRIVKRRSLTRVTGQVTGTTPGGNGTTATGQDLTGGG